MEPQDLVEYGARYVFGDNRHYQREAVTLTAKAGPTLQMGWGAMAIADPWFPQAAPATPAITVRGNDQPTAVTTITL